MADEVIKLQDLNKEDVPADLRAGTYFDFNAHRFEHQALLEQTDSVYAAILGIDEYATKWLVLFRQIFAFVIIQHDTREVIYHALTYHPTQEWTAQQLRNATFDTAPRFLIRDGDGKFGTMFDNVASGSDIEIILSLHPNMNALCERFIGSLRRECLDHVLLLGEEHLRRLLGEYVEYFNEHRPHQGIGQAIPIGAANDNVVATGAVVARPILGGLHHDYRRTA